MHRWVMAALVLLSSGRVARAEAPAIGISLQWNHASFCGTFTGLSQVPPEATGAAGESFGCKYADGGRVGGGLVVQLPLSDRFAFRVDPSLVTHGLAQYEYKQNADRVPLKWVQLPLYGRLVLDPPDRGLTMHLLIGGFVARRWNDDSDLDTIRNVFPLWDLTAVIHDLLRAENWGRWNFGVSVGLGFALKAGPGRVTVEVFHDRGVKDVYDGINRDGHTKAWRVGAGYLLPLRRGQGTTASISPRAAP